MRRPAFTSQQTSTTGPFTLPSSPRFPVPGSQPVLGGGIKSDSPIQQFDGGVGALEVVPGADLAAGLVDSVPDLLEVIVRDDVERRHDSTLPTDPNRSNPVGVVRVGDYPPGLLGRCPSGQRERAVNPSALPSEVQILPGPLEKR